MIMFGVSHRAFVHFEVRDGFGHALGGALLSAAPVYVGLVSLVANIRKSVDDQLRVSTLTGNEVKLSVRLKREL